MFLAAEQIHVLPDLGLAPRWPVIVAMLLLVVGAIASLLHEGRAPFVVFATIGWALLAIEGTVEWLARVALATIAFLYLVARVMEHRSGGTYRQTYSPSLATFFGLAAVATSIWLWADGRVLPLWLGIVYIALLLAAIPLGLRAAAETHARAVVDEQWRSFERERRSSEEAAKAKRERIEAERAEGYRAEMEARAEEQRRATEAERAAEQAKRKAKEAWDKERESRHNETVTRREQAERDSLTQAKAVNAGLGADGFIERTRDVLHHLYDLSAGHTNAAITLNDLVDASGLPPAQALLALRSAEDSEWVAIDEPEPRRFAIHLVKNDYPTDEDLRRLGDWTNKSVHITRRGKDKLEMEPERTVHHNKGDGYVFVQGGDRPRVKVVINKQIAARSGREDVATALLLLKGEVDAAEVAEKARNRGKALLGHVESELAEDDPDPEIVRASLEGLKNTMVDAGETYDAARGWVQRLSDLVKVLSRLIPGAIDWLSETRLD